MRNDEADLMETAVKSHVGSQLDCPVYMEYPEGDTPDYFVILDRTDGSRENQITSGTFLAQSYGPSKLATALFHEKVKDAMDSLYQLSRVAALELIGDYPFPDTKHNRYRYQAVYEITYY